MYSDLFIYLFFFSPRNTSVIFNFCDSSAFDDIARQVRRVKMAMHAHKNKSTSVSVPKVEIVDEHGATAGDKFYKAGSTIELKCVVSNIPQPTGYVTWRHGSRTLNYDTTRGGIRWASNVRFNGTEIDFTAGNRLQI